ncbi:hypothetical protein [Brevundimonas sp. FT23028]|uniref:hypothetical protein n=1 Tax=Brevundimonas sp. FT23028 TaxID=3393748 RepID=UPI003B586C51
MSPVKGVTISSGSVTFHEAREEAFLEADAGPPFFEVAFMVDVESEAEGLTVRNIFHLRTRVGGLPETTPWSEVEARAYAQLAPMLTDSARLIGPSRA